MPRIPLSNNRSFATIDEDDLAIVENHRWHIVKTGYADYAQAWVPYPKAILMHRLLIPDAEVVHHIDGNGLNNKRANLMGMTYSLHNRIGRKGYFYESSRMKWKAQIHIDGKNVFLGRFDTREEASMAYQEALQKWLKDEIKGE